MRILIIDPLFDDEPDVERTVAGDEHEIVVWRTAAAGPVPDHELAACDGLINCRSQHPVTPELIARMKRCRVVSQAGVGFNHIDLEACAARGIPVCNTPDYGTTDVADHTIGLALALLRGIVAYDAKLRTRSIGWHAADQATVRRVNGLRFGIVGLGRIGTATSLRAKAFEMAVDFYDPYLAPGIERALGYARAESLEELLGRADIVSLHTPVTAATVNMIDDQSLAHAKPGLILLNTSRGAVVDLDALERALRSGRLGGVGLDVLAEEPIDYRHPLLQAWERNEDWLDGRIVITPHAAFYSTQSVYDMRRLAIENIVHYLQGGTLRSCVNHGLLNSAR